MAIFSHWKRSGEADFLGQYVWLSEIEATNHADGSALGLSLTINAGTAGKYRLHVQEDDLDVLRMALAEAEARHNKDACHACDGSGIIFAHVGADYMYQRCDTCERFDSDEEACVAYAVPYGPLPTDYVRTMA